MVKCKYGRLVSSVREPRTGFIRRCKLKKKTSPGRKQNRRKPSGEYHERRYRKERKSGKR